jgi:hypothetical protein
MTIREDKRIECPHERCKAPVFLVRLGSNLDQKLLDAESVSWQDGGRIKLLDATPIDSPLPFARRIVHAGKAFGVEHLYRLHDETCKAHQRRARQKATSS